MSDALNQPTDGTTFSLFLRGVLLVLIQLFTLPYRIIVASISSLASWGGKGRVPSSNSEFPVLTFMIVDLKPLAIVVVVLVSVLTAIPSYGTSLLLGYLMLPVVSYGFEIASMLISAVNSLKKLEKQNQRD
jgi:hypothetical protein